MVLLHTLHLCAPKNRWKISVAHFNHQLRGRASIADEKLVQQVAQKLKLPFCVDRADVKKFAAQAKISIEMAARQLRHEFFARVAREQKFSSVALAQHADDQVELFFLRLLRGTSGEGLAGMKWRSASSADKKISLIRPLLGFSKAEVLEFAATEKVRFRDDATNFSNDFLRNRIRNELLPLLTKNYQPGLTKAVLRLMEITGAESEFVSAVARASRPWVSNNKGGAKLETHGREARATATFDKLSVAVQRKVLQQQFVEAGIVTDFELVEQLRASPEKFVSVSLEFSVARDVAGKISGRRQSVVEKFRDDELKVSGRAGRVEFGGRKFDWAFKKYGGARVSQQPRTEFFDADKIGGEIILRYWRAGDRFQPIGLRSAAKLQDLFVNAKVPATERRRLGLATTAAGEIFWVEGLRIGERFKLTPETKRQLVWRFEKGPMGLIGLG